MVNRMARWIAQAVVYAGVVAVIGYFASAPAYRHFPEDRALIKMTFTHGGKYRGGCRRRSAEELQEIAPNMRKKFDCPRDRVPVVVELDIDGAPLYRATLPPSGLHGDGPSIMYEAFSVPAGNHKVEVRLRDTDRAQGFDYVARRSFNLEAKRLLVIQFRAEAGGIVFRE